MNGFEEIGKKMPFKESDAEIDAMLSRIASSTVNGKAAARKVELRRRNFGYVSVAAVFAIALTVAVKMLSANDSYYDLIQESETVAEVLNEMGDEDVEQQVYYTLNTVPEYYLYTQSNE